MIIHNLKAQYRSLIRCFIAQLKINKWYLNKEIKQAYFQQLPVVDAKLEQIIIKQNFFNLDSHLGNYKFYCSFWAIDRNIFRKAIEEISLKDYEQNQEIIQKVKCFQSLTYDQRKAISSFVITLSFDAGKIIVRKGDQADSFFIIKKGEVEIYKGDDQLIRAQEGDSFEEYSLQNNSVRQATVQAYKESLKQKINKTGLYVKGVEFIDCKCIDKSYLFEAETMDSVSNQDEIRPNLLKIVLQLNMFLLISNQCQLNYNKQIKFQMKIIFFSSFIN
ncbi:unnamed protein product [Paramecium sonneborni]|uniref:Cyclic nucleotide-binding domain-containing protein n=1 Tax=Paramecium sonneborni TaxID=65129 RepID=A0A8S1RNM5_9CILI|nr:unnamed protein product [Paramecium sonneborni]